MIQASTVLQGVTFSQTEFRTPHSELAHFAVTANTCDTNNTLQRQRHVALVAMKDITAAVAGSANSQVCNAEPPAAAAVLA
jgi:hypothetical protein